MKTIDIRNQFLNFFESKKHTIVESAPIVVKDDPTLMFTNAGMNQFKDAFLGNIVPKSVRVTDTQKCLRVSGKHNDLEEVGVDTYHHTMFEMLGNWSFGDYFKKEAIEWAWELLTEVYKIDKSNLYITVFGGDKEDGLGVDQEALDIWKNIVSEEQILLCDKRDNFWEMGDQGPCGPCSEIHVDIRSEEDRKRVKGVDLVNQDHPQVIEIWNLVFMEYNRQSNRDLLPLPSTHVDTGMGLERLAVVLQGKQSNYDTDVFANLIKRVEKISGETYERTDSKKDVAIRVISDHVRAVAFTIADGQLPSNTGAGYVIRRILRRAVRYGYSFLGIREAFLYQLVEILCDEMGGAFPSIIKQRELIQKVIQEEEEAFLRTLEKGIKRFNDVAANSNSKIIDGKVAFELYDTYGFPIDLTELLASEEGLTVDMKAFQNALKEQKERSREATKIDADDWIVLNESEKVDFIGYDELRADVKILKYRKIKQKDKELFQVVLDRTPFYPEGGGQVGDSGILKYEEEIVSIKSTKKENNLIIHILDKLPSDLTRIFKAEVNRSKRNCSASNHSATHLLHKALRDILGEHVEQKGSLVNADYLRFDFSHFSKMSEEELGNVESQVNAIIAENVQLNEKRSIPIDEAKSMGAMALFGEKYGDEVRVIKFDNSVELCGGTHVNSTGEIGTFKILSEGSVASGVRRVEAITSVKAREYVQKQLTTLEKLGVLLKNPKDIVKTVDDLLQQNSDLSKQIDQLNREKVIQLKKSIVTEVKEVNGVNFIAKELPLNSGLIKDLTFQLKEQFDRLFAVFASKEGGKATITVAVAEELVEEKGLDAGKIVRELAKEIQGGGGGQKFFATAGGKNPNGIPAAIDKAITYLN